ncbi:MAG: glycosyltransferase family 1 protein [Bacteroidota bacterium]
MKILIDGRVLDRKITGTSRYLLNILKVLPQCDNINNYLLITNSAPDSNRSFYKIINYKSSILPYKLYSPFWLNYNIPSLIKEHRIDILFSPNVLTPINKIKGVKFVSVVHDSIYKIYPEYYPFFYRLYLDFFLPISLNNSDAIVTVSELSKKDITKHFHIHNEKIFVIPNTVSSIFNSERVSEDEKSKLVFKYGLPRKYLLFVGVIEKRKNIFGILKVMDKLKEKGSKLELVLVGKSGYYASMILPEIKKRENFIRYISFIDDIDLASIYKSSFAFIFPSYYEGFGIPPLEAMNCGIPVLSSNTSAMLEVVGNGGILLDPDDHDSFVNEILKLENDEDFYSAMKRNALEQAKKFNLESSTKKLIDIFNVFK